MTAYRSVEIDCDRCGRTAAPADDGPFATAWELRAYLAPLGWSYRIKRQRRDLCPDCS